MTLEEIVAALKDIVEQAQTEDRPLTDEEANRYEELEGELKRAQKTEDIKKRQSAYESVRPAVNVGAVNKGEDTLERAFESYMRTGQANQDIVELRAQSVGTGSAGGFLVPETLRQKLVDRVKAFGGVAANAEEITTAGGGDMPFPTLDDTANSGVIAAEGTAPGSGGADLVFAEKTLKAFKYIAPGASQLPLRVSVELLQDSAFDVEGLVRRKLGERIGRKQASDWVNGAGTTLPFGVTTSGGPSKTFAEDITYAELVDAKHAVDPAYRESGTCKWYFSDATLATVEKLVDTNGRPLLSQSIDGISGAPALMLLGYPVVTDQAFATSTADSGNVFGAFGDLREGYVIRRVKDLTLIVDPYTRANEGQVQYTLWARADGLVQNPYAFALLKNDAS
jgi:HK97 family phage major capsid protein